MKPARCPTGREDECMTQIQGSDALLQSYCRTELIDLRKTHICKKGWGESSTQNPSLQDFTSQMHGEYMNISMGEILGQLMLKCWQLFSSGGWLCFVVVCFFRFWTCLFSKFSAWSLQSCYHCTKATTVQGARSGWQPVDPNARVQSPALLLRSSSTLSEWFNFSGPQFPHL